MPYSLKTEILICGLILLCAGNGSGQYHVYWGDVHGHTNLSDGKGSLDDFLTYARDTSNLDFVIVTDHDFGSKAPWRMPKEAWTLTQEKADAYTVPGRFVAIAGYEWSSAPKYWSGYTGKDAEPHFEGTPKFYSHKNVYFSDRIEYIFSAKDPAYMTPDLLAAAVRKAGGLAQNNHPSDNPPERDQFEYSRSNDSVIANTEMLPDVLHYEGKTYTLNTEQAICDFLNKGGKTGFVSGTDTHEGKPIARTAVLAQELTREGIFEALRHRRNYAVSNAKIVLEFSINGYEMGEEIEIEGKPRIHVNIRGTDKITEVVIIRDGALLRVFRSPMNHLRFDYVDQSFDKSSYYYLRVTQADKDEHGNPSYAWSSPIWVRQKGSK